MRSFQQPTETARRARVAVAILFFTNGAIFANLAPRYPEMKRSLELSTSSYGVAIAAWPAGAMIAGLAAGLLIQRFTSAKMAVIGTIVTSLATLLAVSAPNLAFFMIALGIGGGMDAITDVAQNSHGLRVQRSYGRSIINSFHAIWSIGAVTGGIMATIAIALGLPLPLHLAFTTVLVAGAAIFAHTMTLTGPEPAAMVSAQTATPGQTGRTSLRIRTWLILAGLVLVAMAGAIAEDAGNSWATLYLEQSLQAPAAIATMGFIALVGAQFIGRMLGDRLTDRFGERAVARTGALIAAAGLGLALAFPSVPGTIAGYAATGFGIATLIPAAMDRADNLPGLSTGTGLTVVSWLLRVGFLVSPPVIGAIAHATSIRVGLIYVPVALAVGVVAAGALRGKRDYDVATIIGDASPAPER